MNYKIITFTLILALFLSPKTGLVYAQDNETEGTNSTIPFPPLDLNTTLTNTTLPGINATSTDGNSTDTDGEPVDPVILALLREQAQNRTQEMLQLFGNGTYSPDIMNGLMHAQQAMEQAMNFEGNNTRAAAQQYLRAMKQYRNTLRQYLHNNPDALETFEEAGPDENTTATEDVNGTVTEAELTAAQTQLIEEFEERFREQITAMIQNVNDLSGDMSPQDIFQAQQALTKAEEKLLRIQERILSGQYDDALDDLENATDTLDDDFNKTDPGTAQMLRTMNQLEAKIQKMEQRAEKKAARGQSTTEEDTLLAELRGNKDHTKNDYKENKGNSDNNGNGGKSDKDKGKPDKDKSNKGKGNN